MNRPKKPVNFAKMAMKQTIDRLTYLRYYMGLSCCILKLLQVTGMPIINPFQNGIIEFHAHKLWEYPPQKHFL
jgi:hypothetical protein